MQKIHFITGATGLVGSYLARYLIAGGEKVRALKRETSGIKLVADVADKIEWIDGDITDIEILIKAMEGVQYVYHCAAIISYVSKDRQRLMDVNVSGTANVVNACLDLPVEKMIFISSIAAIGRTGLPGEHVRESNKWEDNAVISDYSKSKYLAEREVWRGIAEGLNAVIVNPSIIIGSGEWNSGSCRLFTTVFNGFKFYTEGITGYVDVRDVVRISCLLMESNISGERFILNSENLMYRNFLWMIADALHTQRAPYKAKKLLSEIAWRADAVVSIFTGKTPTVTKATSRIANKQVYFENEKITSVLQYQFIPVTQSITDTANAFLHENKTGVFKPIDF